MKLHTTPRTATRHHAAVAALVLVFALITKSDGRIPWRPKIVQASLSHEQDRSSIPRSYRLAASASIDYMPGELMLPSDVAVGPDGTLYATDFTSHTVIVINRDGTERERWHHQLTGLTCDGVFVPVAVDATTRGELAILWHFFRVRDDTVQFERVTSLVELRNQDGAVTSMFRVAAEFTDLSLFNDRVYLVQPNTITVSSRNGAINSDWRLLISAVRQQPASFDLFSADRIAAIKDNGTVHIQSVSPYTDELVDMGTLRALAVDIDESTLHVLAVDPTTWLVHHLEYDAAGRQLLNAKLNNVPFQNAAVGDWPIGAAVQSSRLAAITANDSGLVISQLDEMKGQISHIQGARPDGASPDRPTTRGHTLCGDGTMSLGTADNNGIHVYDDQERQIIAYNSDLERVSAVGIDMAVENLDAMGSTDGEFVLLSAAGRIRRVNSRLPNDPIWDAACNCSAAGRLAWNADQLVVANRAEKRIQRHDADTGSHKADIVGQSQSELWPFDVAVYTTGEVVATDLIEKRIQRFSKSGTQLSDIATGFAVGPKYIAVADSPVVGQVVVTSMWDEQFELRELASGNLLVRWPAEANGIPYHIADIGIDAQLRIYTLDARKRVLYRYDPQPDEVPSVQATPASSRTTCLVEGNKIAAPRTVVLGNSATITLTIRADCPMASSGIGADIMLIADNSSSMTQVMGPLRKAISDFSDNINLDQHRIGLVTFRREASLVSPLSHARRDLGALIGDPQDDNGDGSSLHKGISVAREHLLSSGNSDAIPMIVLLSDGGSYGDVNEVESRKAKDAGIQLFVIALGATPAHSVLRPLASSPAHYFATWTPDDLFLMFRQVAHQITASRIGNLVIVDELSDDVEYVDGSAFPPASSGQQQVRWGRGVLPSTGMTLTLQLRPRRIGLKIPTSKMTDAQYTDADGSLRRFEFPIPHIDVIAPSPTPTETPQATETRTPAPISLYLPLLLHEESCQPELQSLDVMLVIDASNSMSGAKLAAAQEAALAFRRMLHLGKDRIGLATFNTDARLLVGLTTTATAFDNAVSRISLSPGTRMDSGLSLALGTMLASPRPAAIRAVVLLTDGRQDSEPHLAQEAATALGNTGINLLAVGLGGDADIEFLRELVADAAKVRHVTDSRALTDVYRQIARELPCSKELFWGGR